MLRPLKDHYLDDGSAILANISVVENGRAIEIALIGTSSDPQMIRLSVSGIDRNPTNEERKRFDDLAESMLAHLRIFHDNEIAFAIPAFRYANLIDDHLPPELNINIGKSKSAFDVDSTLIQSFMHSDKELQNILRLYADSLYPYLPVQYRYLSAFKIIEHEFKLSRRKWKPELDVLLSNFQTEYDALGLSKMGMKALMINLRDKCAHIKLDDADYLSIVGIGSQDTEIVAKFLPLLTEIIRNYIFDTYKSDGTAFHAVKIN